MEGVSVRVYKGLRGYWRRRGYEKLNGSGRRQRTRVEQLGSARRRSLFWRTKISPKLCVLRLPSPKRFFVRLRDWYVNLMLRMTNSQVCSVGGYGGGFCEGNSGFSRVPLKEYDEKVIIDIYKSMLMAQGHLVPREAAKIC